MPSDCFQFTVMVWPVIVASWTMSALLGIFSTQVPVRSSGFGAWVIVVVVDCAVPPMVETLQR